MQILKGILAIFLFSLFIIGAIELYKDSEKERLKNINIGENKMKQELILSIEKNSKKNCKYSNIYENIITEKELKSICFKLEIKND